MKESFIIENGVLVQYVGEESEVVIPDRVTALGERVFCYRRGLASIIMPDSVTSIGDWAFRGCSGFTNIVIPDSVKSIGKGAFLGCSGLKSVAIGDSVRSVGHKAFFGCSSLKKIIYQGAITQWEAVDKVLDWDKSTGDFKIICLDGTLNKKGTKNYKFIIKTAY